MKYFFVILLLALFVSCSPAKILSRPEWRLQGIRIDHIDRSKVTLGINAEITNPNAFTVTVRSVRYQFYLGESLVAQGEKTEPFDLPGHGATEVSLPAEISLTAVRQLAPLLKKDPQNSGAPWRLEGESVLKVFGVEKTFPFKKEESKRNKPAIEEGSERAP